MHSNRFWNAFGIIRTFSGQTRFYSGLIVDIKAGDARGWRIRMTYASLERTSPKTIMGSVSELRE